MSQPPRQFFTVTDFDSLSVTTALVQDDILTIAKGDHSLSLPTLIALDIAAETIRLLLDDDDITNGPGLSLSEWLGDDDSEEAAMFDPGRFPPAPAACYRAPWRLPGPDSHRLAVFQAHAWVSRRVHHFCFLQSETGDRLGWAFGSATSCCDVECSATISSVDSGSSGASSSRAKQGA